MSDGRRHPYRIEIPESGDLDGPGTFPGGLANKKAHAFKEIRLASNEGQAPPPRKTFLL